VQAMVAAGMGVAVVPRLTVDFKDPDTTALPLAGTVPPRRIGLVWHEDRYRPPASHGFVETAQQVCEQYAGDEQPAAAGA
jgi:DNA-binding transcriptional LysR family regulator